MPIVVGVHWAEKLAAPGVYWVATHMISGGQSRPFQKPSGSLYADYRLHRFPAERCALVKAHLYEATGRTFEIAVARAPPAGP
jgi:hypothetical protein